MRLILSYSSGQLNPVLEIEVNETLDIKKYSDDDHYQYLCKDNFIRLFAAEFGAGPLLPKDFAELLAKLEDDKIIDNNAKAEISAIYRKQHHLLPDIRKATKLYWLFPYQNELNYHQIINSDINSLQRDLTSEIHHLTQIKKEQCKNLDVVAEIDRWLGSFEQAQQVLKQFSDRNPQLSEFESEFETLTDTISDNDLLQLFINKAMPYSRHDDLKTLLGTCTK